MVCRIFVVRYSGTAAKKDGNWSLPFCPMDACPRRIREIFENFCFEAQSEAFASCFVVVFLPSSASPGRVQDGIGIASGGYTKTF